MKSGAELIAEERKKQIEKHGRDAEHDQQYVNEELAEVAARLAMGFADDTWRLFERHPKRIDQLVIAGALIAAEIDRRQAQEPQS